MKIVWDDVRVISTIKSDKVSCKISQNKENKMGNRKEDKSFLKYFMI